MIKYQSEAIRNGPPADHEEAVQRVIDFWKTFSSPKYKKWIVDEHWLETYKLPFIRKMKLDRGNRDHFEHECDICFFEWVEDQPTPRLIIEVDGESHDKPARKITDGTFEEWITEKYKGFCKLIRINKRELIGDIELTHEHLRNVLGEYLQKK